MYPIQNKKKVSPPIIPAMNTPICLINFTYQSNDLDIHWMTTTLFPTNRQRYRTWSINLAGYIISDHLESFQIQYTFTGTSSYLIDFEKFPITGQFILNGQTYNLNSELLSCQGVNYQQNKSIQFDFHFTNPVKVTQPLFMASLYIYDNPGIQIFH